MSIFPGTGIPKSFKPAKNTLMICGESPSEVFANVSEILSDWESTRVVDGFREFHLTTWSKGQDRINVFVGGLGSASVELMLQDGTLSGMKNFILSGSCATLEL